MPINEHSAFNSFEYDLGQRVTSSDWYGTVDKRALVQIRTGEIRRVYYIHIEDSEPVEALETEIEAAYSDSSTQPK